MEIKLEKVVSKDDVFYLINAKNKTEFKSNLDLLIKEGKIPPVFLDLSYEEFKQWKTKTNKEPIHLCEQDSVIYANKYNDSRVETDKEQVDFEVWQRNLLDLAEKENIKLTRGGLGGGSYNSYAALFNKKQEAECKETNLMAIAKYKRFLPYTEENKRLLAEAFVKILYASDLEEIENNIKVIISGHQFLRLSQFGTNTDTGLATDIQFFQNSQEGGKTTVVMSHKKAIEELGLSACLSDLTKISGIYNNEAGIGTSHICYFPEETYKNGQRIDFGKYEQLVKQVKNIGLNIKQGKIIPASSNACYMGGTNSTGNLGNRINGYVIFDDGFIAREQNIVKADELTESWKTIFLLTPDIKDIDWNIGSINMNRRIKTDKSTTDLIKLIENEFKDDDNIKDAILSYRKLQRHYFEGDKNPNKYAWKKIIGELKKALALNLISINNTKFDNYTVITFNADKDEFVNELLGLDKTYNYKEHYKKVVEKVYSFFAIEPPKFSDNDDGSYHSYQNINKEVLPIEKNKFSLVEVPLVENLITAITNDNNLPIYEELSKEEIANYAWESIKDDPKFFEQMKQARKNYLKEEQEKENKLIVENIQKQIKKDYYKNHKKIPVLTEDQEDLLYGNHIKNGSNDLIGQNLSKLLFYGFYLDEIKENWKKYKEHYNHIENFGKKIQENNGFIEWLSIEEYEKARENGNEGKYLNDIIIQELNSTDFESQLEALEIM
jgi:hypothetical protein